MEPINRRGFFGTSLAGAATLALGSQLLARGLLARGPAANPGETPLFGPDGYTPNTLFLTWQRDPTTTMTVQWLAPETPEDKSIHYRLVMGTKNGIGTTITKPYTNTELKVYRAELSGLEPDGEYEFQIGSSSPKYCFRTMPAKATNVIQFITGGDSGIDLAYDNGQSPNVRRG